jgi:hypothetical protein
MSETKIIYRGITLTQVRIEEYRIDNVASPDSPSTGILRHTIIGEALVFEYQQGGIGNTSNKKFTDQLIQVLNSPRGDLLVEIATGASNNSKYTVFNNYLGSSPIDVDEMNGPFFKANITQITGTNAVIVNFTIEFAKSAESGNRIKNLVCLASFSIDEVGLTTIRKTGSIQLASQSSFLAGSPATVQGLKTDTVGSPDTATFNNRYLVGDGRRNDIIVDFVTASSGANGNEQPDFYRRLISGNLDRGFRRIRQEYAIDESRTRLLFDIVDQEFTRGLPAPARVGDCHYSFERQLGENNAIGLKHFVATVKGDRNVTSGALLTLCIRLSQNRIDYKKDLIVRVKVAENNMLSENSLTYEVAAKATSSQNFQASDGPPETGGIATPIDNSLLLKNILSPIPMASVGNQAQAFEFFPAFQPDAYGSATIVRVVPSAYNHQTASSQLNLASTIKINEQNPVIYQFPKGTFDTAEQFEDGINYYIKKDTAAVPTGPNRGDLSKARDASNPNAPANTQNPAYVSKGGQKIEVRTGIIVVPSLCVNGGAALFQMGAPTAVVTDYLDGSRKNEPPVRALTDKPATSAIASYGMAVSSGIPDANGNRVLTAAHDRVAIVYPPDDITEADLDADPPVPGGSIANPAYKIVTASVNGQNFRHIAFFPNKLDMPPDETQGTFNDDAPPTYTTGLGTPEVLA